MTWFELWVEAVERCRLWSQEISSHVRVPSFKVCNWSNKWFVLRFTALNSPGWNPGKQNHGISEWKREPQSSSLSLALFITHFQNHGPSVIMFQFQCPFVSLNLNTAIQLFLLSTCQWATSHIHIDRNHHVFIKLIITLSFKCNHIQTIDHAFNLQRYIFVLTQEIHHYISVIM